MKEVQRMKIAITGGTGFLGKYVVESIKKENHIPVVFSRRVVDNLENDLEYRMTDYSKTDLIKNLFGIDAVVHLAAKRGIKER